MINRITLARPKLFTMAMLLVSSLCLAPAKADEALAEVTGAGADSFVIGTGIVIGLAGTGDTEVDEQLVDKSIVGVLRQAGLDPWHGEIAPGRVAKVIVTAELSPNAAAGAPFTVTVTAAGNATSLAGGTLLATPLRYGSGEVHSIGQGRIAMKNQVATVDGGKVVVGRAQELVAAN